MRAMSYDDLVGPYISHLVVKSLSPLLFFNLYGKNGARCCKASDQPLTIRAFNFSYCFGGEAFIARTERAFTGVAGFGF